MANSHRVYFIQQGSTPALRVSGPQDAWYVSWEDRRGSRILSSGLSSGPLSKEAAIKLRERLKGGQ